MVVCLSKPFGLTLCILLCTVPGFAGVLAYCLAFQKDDSVDQCRWGIPPGLPPALRRRKRLERMDVNHIVLKAAANPPSKMSWFRP